MALLAEGFPCGQIPEQPLITPVRNDMIHYCGSAEMAGLFFCLAVLGIDF